MKKRDFWYFVLEFDPTHVKKLEVDQGELERSLNFHRVKIQQDGRTFIREEYLEETIRLFLFLQKLYPEKYPVLPPDLKKYFAEYIEESIAVGDFPDQIILAYLKTTPEDHARIKRQLKDQHISLPKVENSVTDELPPQIQIQLLAATKMMLAEEIEILPSGELRAVERGQLGKASPLPERSAV